MMRLWWVIALLLCVGHQVAEAKPLIADMSRYRIEIDSGFTGTRLLLFGTRNETGDVLIVIRGPESNYMIRKKEQVGGFLWLNRYKQRFKHVPIFYMFASSKAIKDMKNTDLFTPLGIGFQQVVGEGKPDFVSAFLAAQRDRGLYNVPIANAPVEKISFMDESLFKLMLPFPDNIPRGDYSADIYLVNDGRLVSMQSIPLQVERTGMDAFIYRFAHEYGFLYGLCAMVMALSLGWGASRWLHKW